MTTTKTLKICFNGETSKYMDSAAYLNQEALELGYKSFINRTDKKADCDVAFNCESAPYFIRGKDKTFIYHIDPTWNHANNISHRIDECDLIFSTHKNVPYKDSPKFRYLPHASYKGWHEEVSKIYDIFLPPSPPGRRDREEMSAKIPKEFNTHTVPYGTPTKDYITQMRKCLIILNLSGRGDVNRKIFDGMLHGVLVTNELDELPGIEGTHYFTYKVNEGPNKVLKEILSDPVKLDEVDRVSTKFILDNHTYTHRVKEILKCI